jgi:phosphoglycolate phosphatase-like HAD superfamily hydrolase
MEKKAEKSGKIAPYELAFDVDGVFADTFRIFVKTAREQYGIQVEYEDITEYNFREVIDIDEKTSYEIIQRILDNPLKMGILPVFGAVDVLTRLSQIGPLLFVSARP